MDTLSSERRAQLMALLNELATRPTYECIVRGAEVVGFNPNREDEVTRVDAAMAGSWAHNRAILYLERLRILNQERMDLGEEIGKLSQRPDPTPESSEAEVEAWAWAKNLIPHLAGRQEVVINFFCICIQHIRSLLRVVGEAVEYELPAEDDAFLDEFRHLRNHFEHWYSRLPGKQYEVGLMTKTMTSEEYRFRGGVQSAGNDRIKVIDPRKSPPETHIVDVSNAGVARVERIVQETDAKVRELVLERVRGHFLANPNQRIPSPDEVPNDPIIDVGWSDQ